MMGTPSQFGIRRSNARRSLGQTLTEFALVIPLLLLLFMGILDLARAAYTLNAVGDAARNGVREAIINQSCPAITDRAQSAAVAVDLSATNAVQTTIYMSPVVSNTPTPDTCAGGLGGGYGIGWLAEVRVTANFTTITPIVGQLVGPLSLSSTARLPLERAYP